MDSLEMLEINNDRIESSIINNNEIAKTIVLNDLSNKNEIMLLVK